MLISIENQTTFDTPLSELEKIASALTSKEIELIITDALTIQEMNASYRFKDMPTDVLSFPIEGRFEGVPLGSIVICVDFIYEKAELLGHTPEQESQLLFIHGLLHLLGFDHESDNGEMREEEEVLIKKFNLPDSLIVRTYK